MWVQERKNMKHRIKILPLIMTVCMLTGCQVKEKKGDITFIEEKEIEYSHDFKISDLIEQVDDYTRKDFKIEENDKNIELPNGKTVAINTTNREIELDTIKFTFRYANKNFTKEVVIQDTTAPTILCEDTYKVLVNNEYFNLEHLIKVEDNYSNKEDIELYYNGSYDIKTVGTYDIEVIAYDKKKNKAIKEVKVIVEQEESSEQVTGDNNQNSNEGSSGNGGNSGGTSNHQPVTPTPTPPQNPPTPPAPPINNQYIPQSKEFTIDTYATFDECYTACQSYITQCMQQGYSGIATAEPIKRDGVYIGYKAVFN